MADTLANVFDTDAFSLYSLSAAAAKFPPARLSISDLGIFKPESVTGTLVAVEESRGKLTVIPTTARGSKGIAAQPDKRVATPFKVPQIKLFDVVRADDALNVRQFGTANPQTPENIIAARQESMRRSLDFTAEYLRHGALQGKVIYPDNSYDAALDLYTEFGMTNQATNQTSVNFTFGTSTTKIIQSVVPQINDAIEAALGSQSGWNGQVYALCGRTFFRNLVGHSEVKDLYKQVLAQYALSAVTQAPGAGAPRLRIQIGNVTFEEYYNIAGASQGVGNDGLFQVAAEARAFPIGPDIYRTYFAPADVEGAVGTPGQPVYSYFEPQQSLSYRELVMVSNQLNICTLPKALIRLYTSN